MIVRTVEIDVRHGLSFTGRVGGGTFYFVEGYTV